MGGAVSSGRDNNELIDNLMGGNYIRSRHVERVFRALDRADYMTPESRDQAYKDLAWRNGPLHMSAPCIYSEVMEGLQLKPGLSFLNVGSGTGYLSTLVGLVLGSGGINHGIEVHSQVVEYANKKLQLFMENSVSLDEFDFCEPKFYCGNGLCLAPLQTPYDRVYCGAGCPDEYQSYFQQLIKVGGVLVMPLNDNLLQVRRVSATEWSTRSVLNVSFATLRVPTKEEDKEMVRLEEQSPARLQALSRAVIRESMRAAMLRRHPALREPPPRAPPAKKACPRRICIPVDDDSDADLNALHDLDPENGAHEMNALLSLVLSMGRNRVAGALRVDPIDSESSSNEDTADEGDEDNNDDDDAPGNDGDAAPLAAEGNSGPHSSPEGSRTENPESAERSKTPEVPEQNVTESRPERSNRRDRNSRPERPERESGDRSERPEPRDRSARSDRSNRGERGDRSTGDRSDRSERRNRGDRAERRDRFHRSDRAGLRSVFTFEIRDSSPDNAEENTEADNPRSTALVERDPAENSRDLSAVSTPERTNEEAKGSTSGEATPSRNRAPRGNLKLICRRNRKPRDVHHSSRGSQTSDEKNDGEQSNPEVPAEVEIFLGKSREEPGTSSMEWQPAQPAQAEDKTEVDEGAEPKEHSSEDDTETSTSKTKEEKRQKLDSGIGDDNTVSATSSRSSKDSEPSDSERDDSSLDDEGVDGDVRGRRRRQKRGHLSTRSSSSTDDDDEEGFELAFPEEGIPSRRPKRRDRPGPADDPRRLSLSLYMKRGVKELPLPFALQKYVNLGRCFEV